VGEDRIRIVLLWVAAAVSAAVTIWFVQASLAIAGFRPDFTVFWTAARLWFERPGDLYDVVAITRAQDAIVGEEGARPWVYPPSFLPWVAPLGLLPVWPAMVAWCAVTAALFAIASFILTRDWRAVALSFVATSLVMGLFSGQSSLLLGALVLAGCAALRDRPWLAGVLFGLAATIKPQAVSLVPLALIVGRQWTALGAAVVTGLLVGGLSYASGPQLWWDWLETLRVFPAIVEAMDLSRRSLGATGIAPALGLDGWMAQAATIGGFGLGLAVTALVWWRSADMRLRAAALLAGSLLVSPYAMGYDASALAPLGFAMLGDRTLTPRHWAAGVLLTMMANAVITVLAVALLLWALGQAHAGGRGQHLLEGRRTRWEGSGTAP